MDVITSRVEYRSSVFIKTVFEATFSLSGDIESNRYRSPSGAPDR